MRSFFVMRWWRPLWVLGAAIFLSAGPNLIAQDRRATPTYRRFKQELDAIAAIDTHDHLFPYDRLPCIVERPGTVPAITVAAVEDEGHATTTSLKVRTPKLTSRSVWPHEPAQNHAGEYPE